MSWFLLLISTNKLRVILLAGSVFALASCTATPPAVIVDTPVKVIYDAQSWRGIIPSRCRRYFDGCNNCMRSDAQGMGACTRKACFEYSMPHCLDKEAVEPSNSYRKVIYLCDNDVTLSVFHGEYRSDDLRIKLTPEQIYLSDSGTHTAYLLSRKRSASGEKYGDERITFHAKGQGALMMKDDNVSYQNCTVDP